MMMVDDVVVFARAEDRWDTPLLQEATQFASAFGEALNLAALRLDGAHSDGHLGGADLGQRHRQVPTEIFAFPPRQRCSPTVVPGSGAA